MINGVKMRVPGPLGTLVLRNATDRFGIVKPNASSETGRRGIPRRKAFPNISADRFYEGLIARNIKPSLMDQKMSGLCLTTSFMFIVANSNPIAYWNYAYDMFENGKAKLGALRIEPGHDCKNIRLTTGLAKSMHETDWVALASFRDSMNWFFDVDDEDDENPASGTPQELFDWFQDCKLFRDARLVPCNGSNNPVEAEQNFLQAQNLYSLGYWIAPRVNAGILEGTIETGNVRPNHRVVMCSPVTRVGDQVSVDIFTWGHIKTYTALHSDFIRHYFGFVAARP